LRKTYAGHEEFISYKTPVAIMWASNFLALVTVGSHTNAYKLTVFAAVFVVFLTLDVFFMENSWYILDLAQQSTAFYFQKVVQHRLDMLY
jgi:ABC-type uncharacterized transport system permease subunit